MRQFLLMIRTKDEIDLVNLAKDLNELLKKHDVIGLLNEVINPLILDEKNNDIGYS